MTEPDDTSHVLPQCSACGEVHELLYVHSRCHPDDATWVAVNFVHGTAAVLCSVCDTEIIVLPLAKDDDSA